MTEQTFAYWLEHGITDFYSNKARAAIERHRKLKAYQVEYRQLIIKYRKT